MGKKKDDPGKAKIEEMGMMAGEAARKATLEACEKIGLSAEKVVKAIAAGLTANQVKLQNVRGVWAVSAPYVDHAIRLKAAEQAAVILDMKPTARTQVDLTTRMSDEEIDQRLKALLGGTKKA